jgi:hypothetical protein
VAPAGLSVGQGDKSRVHVYVDFFLKIYIYLHVSGCKT